MPAADASRVAELEALVASEASDADALVAKEAAIQSLSELYAEAKQADKLVAMVAALRPFFSVVAKAKTAKIVRNLIDQLAKIPDTLPLQMQLCRDSIAWCKAEKRSFLRQRVEARLAALMLESKMYTEALALLDELLREVKRLDDKPLLVEINLVESATHHALRNLPKAKASLTSARTAANAIYCPPLLQAQIDVNAGCLHAEEKDFKTAFSYFYEALENFDSIQHARGEDCIKCARAAPARPRPPSATWPSSASRALASSSPPPPLAAARPGRHPPHAAQPTRPCRLPSRRVLFLRSAQVHAALEDHDERTRRRDVDHQRQAGHAPSRRRLGGHARRRHRAPGDRRPHPPLHTVALS